MPGGFLMLFIALAACNDALSSSVNLPCEYSQDNNQLFYCNKTYLEIPSTFDAKNIPHNVTELELTAPDNDDSRNIRKCGSVSFCNVLKATAPPFPAMPQLRTITFLGFEGEGGVQFSVNQLLENAKPYLSKLVIQFSRIGSLDADYFKGFSALETLYMLSNDIAAIAVNTFQSVSASRPVLNSLSFGNNRIQSFDWAVLQPVAESIKFFALDAQKPGLHTIYRSSPKFSLKNVSQIALENNNLSSIPKEVFETLDVFPHEDNIFRFNNNAFCPTDAGCSCCGFKELQNWMGYVNQTVGQTAKDNQEFYFELECGQSDSPSGSQRYDPNIHKTQGNVWVRESRDTKSYVYIWDLTSYPNKAIC